MNYVFLFKTKFHTIWVTYLQPKTINNSYSLCYNAVLRKTIFLTSQLHSACFISIILCENALKQISCCFQALCLVLQIHVFSALFHAFLFSLVSFHFHSIFNWTLSTERIPSTEHCLSTYRTIWFTVASICIN